MSWYVVLMVLAGIPVLAVLGFVFYFLVFALSRLGLWIEVHAAGVPLRFWDLLIIRLQRLDEQEMVESMKTLWKAGQQVPMSFLQSHVLAGGSLARLTQAAIAADKAGLPVDYRSLAGMDLAGRNIVEAVHTSVMPKVVVCPQPGGAYGNRGIVGVAQDGISLSVKVRITVRTKLDSLVGGAGEGTVVARVGEGIVSALGKAKSHKDILARPELIAENILAGGLDAGTCFEILSVDIAHVDVVENVKARLDTKQAEADKRIAQARAAQARANACAQQQEMRAVKLANLAKVVQAKAQLPLAFRAALDTGNVGGSRPFRPLLPPQADFWRGKFAVMELGLGGKIGKNSAGVV